MSLTLSTRRSNGGYWQTGVAGNNVGTLKETPLPYPAVIKTEPAADAIKLPISDIVMAYFGVKVWTLTTPFGALDIDVTINNTNGPDFSAYSFYGNDPATDPLLAHVKETFVSPLWQWQHGGVFISGTGGTGQTFFGNFLLTDPFSGVAPLVVSSTANKFWVKSQCSLFDTVTGGSSQTVGVPGTTPTSGTMFFMSGSQPIYITDGGGIGVSGDVTLQPKTFW